MSPGTRVTCLARGEPIPGGLEQLVLSQPSPGSLYELQTTRAVSHTSPGKLCGVSVFSRYVGSSLPTVVELVGSRRRPDACGRDVGVRRRAGARGHGRRQRTWAAEASAVCPVRGRVADPPVSCLPRSEELVWLVLVRNLWRHVGYESWLERAAAPSMTCARSWTRSFTSIEPGSPGGTCLMTSPRGRRSTATSLPGVGVHGGSAPPGARDRAPLVVPERSWSVA